jgi:hypothetical protein
MAKKKKRETFEAIRVRVSCGCGAISEPLLLTRAMFLCSSCGHPLFGSNLAPKPEVYDVDLPCSGCTSCCRNDKIFLKTHLGDDPSLYETRTILHQGVARVALAVDGEGDCVYIGEKGCTIHDRRPAVCRGLDCRRILLYDWRKMYKAGLVSREQILAARAMTKMLGPPPEAADV